MIKAAGIMFLTDKGETLLLKRGPGGDWPGAWCFPGGKMEYNETLEQTAKREAKEELGLSFKGELKEWTRRISINQAPGQSEPLNPVPDLGDPVDYTTFLYRIDKPFIPQLNGEHTAFAWIHVSKLLDDNSTKPSPGKEIVR